MSAPTSANKRTGEKTSSIDTFNHLSDSNNANSLDIEDNKALKSQNDELKARLDYLESMVNSKVQAVMRQQDLIEQKELEFGQFDSNTTVSMDLEIENEQKKLSALIQQNELLAQSIQMLSERQQEEALKLETLERAGRERQEFLMKEIQEKKRALEAKELEIEEAKMAKSVANSQSKSITKIQNAHRDSSGKVKTPSRKSAKNSYYNSWMESDEESAASSLRRDDSDHSKSRIRDSSFNSKQSPKQFTAENKNGQAIDDQNQSSRDLNESSNDSPIRPYRQPNYPNSKSNLDKDSSYRKDSIPYSNSNRNITDNSRRGNNWRNQANSRGDHTGGNAGGRQQDKGKMKMYRMDSREAIQEDNNEQDYNEKYKTIKYYDDYYNKYKTNVKRKFEMIEDHDYVKKGQENNEPANENGKNRGQDAQEESPKQKKRKRRKREFWDLDLDTFGNKEADKQKPTKISNQDVLKDEGIVFVGSNKANKQNREETEASHHKPSIVPNSNHHSKTTAADGLKTSPSRGRTFQFKGQERSQYNKPSR